MTSTDYAPQVKVGDVFYTSWGYDQSNVDFYQTVNVSASGKTIKLIQVGSKTIEGVGVVADVDSPFGGSCANCHQFVRKNEQGVYVHNGYQGNGPKVECREGYGDGVATPTVYTKRVKTYSDKPVLNWCSYANAYLWDSEPKFDSTKLGYAGH